MKSLDVPQFDKPEWTQRSPNFRRRLLLTALVDGLVFVLLVVAGEAGMRHFVPQWKAFIFTEDLTGGNPIALNSHGVRTPEYPMERPEGETRILCLGNSTTFGSGVAVEDTYPRQLETVLNGSDEGGPYFVINAGGQGVTAGDVLEFLSTEGIAYEPSVVTIGFSPSLVATAMRARKRETPAEEEAPEPSLPVRAKREFRRTALRIHAKLSGSYLYTFLDTNIRRRMYRLGLIRDRLDKRTGAIYAYAFDVPGVELEEVEGAYELVLEWFVEIQQLLDERGVPLLVVGIPSQFRISDLSSDNERGFDLSAQRIEPMERMGQFCAEAGIPYLDLRSRYSQERARMVAGEIPWDDLFVPFDYTHLNRYGHRVAAEQIAERIRVWLP